MTEKNLGERYGLKPMERSFYLVTPTRFIPPRKMRVCVALQEMSGCVIWYEKPEGYYLRGYAIIAQDGGFRSVAIFCQEQDITIEEIEIRLANVGFGCYGWEVWA